MKIPEYKLKQEKDFYFLIKDPTVMKKQESHNPSFFLGPKNSVEFWNPNGVFPLPHTISLIILKEVWMFSKTFVF